MGSVVGVEEWGIAGSFAVVMLFDPEETKLGDMERVDHEIQLMVAWNLKRCDVCLSLDDPSLGTSYDIQVDGQ
jgi:hypothetical protein